MNNTEVWEIYNFTADAHPIHIHEVMFQVVNRQKLEADEEGWPSSRPNWKAHRSHRSRGRRGGRTRLSRTPVR